MMIKNDLRVERTTRAGVMLTGPELADVVDAVAGPDADSPLQEAFVNIRNSAKRAGSLACNRSGECKLTISALDLSSVVSDVDAELRASCTTGDCDVTGVTVAERRIEQIVEEALAPNED